MKTNFLTKISIGYITLINLYVALMLIFNIELIIQEANVILLVVIIAAIGTSILNVRFMFDRNFGDRIKVMFLNGVLCVLISVKVRAIGVLFDNLMGIQFNGYFRDNHGGTDYGFSFVPFNISLILASYDRIKFPGFSIEINFVTLSIAGYLLYLAYSAFKIGSNMRREQEV